MIGVLIVLIAGDIWSDIYHIEAYRLEQKSEIWSMA